MFREMYFLERLIVFFSVSWKCWHFCIEEQNKFSKKVYLEWGLNLGPCDTLCCLTWQVLIGGYLTYDAGAPIDYWTWMI